MIEYWNAISFANLSALFLLVIPICYLGWFIWRYRMIYPDLKLPSLQSIKPFRSSIRGKLKPLLVALRLLTLSLLILALARPQTSLNEEEISTEGIDIVIALDVSTSMLALDFKPNRLEAAKDVASEFIKDRTDDRIGLVVFAGESFTQCPITTDYTVLQNLLKEVKDGLIEDGTAIGMGLATSVNRLKDSDAKSKVVILLTDGENNSGFIDPLTATEAAEQFDVRVYTIGVGTRGMAQYPVPFGNRIVYQNVEVNIDEDLLKEVASMTGGKYFRATNNESLKQVYAEIDELEKTKIKISSFTRTTEEFLPFALLGSLLFALEIFCRYTFLKSVP